MLDQIVDGIRSGKLVEGDYLPSERELVETCAVSRSAVREAIKALIDAGVLEARPGAGGGTRVRSIWVAESLALERVRLRGDELADLLEARRAIEPIIAQLAALRARDEHFEAMENSIELTKRYARVRTKWLQVGFQFHHAMWEAAGNRELASEMLRIFRRIEFEREGILGGSDDIAQEIRSHESTLRALKRGDEAEIAAAMDEHLWWLEKTYEEAFDRRLRRPVPPLISVALPDRFEDAARAMSRLPPAQALKRCLSRPLKVYDLTFTRGRSIVTG